MSLDEDLKLFPAEPKFYALLILSLDNGCFIAKSFYEFFPAFSILLILGFCDIWGETGWIALFEYWSIKFLAGGQARVLLGIVFGIGSDINGSTKMS